MSGHPYLDLNIYIYITGIRPHAVPASNYTYNLVICTSSLMTLSGLHALVARTMLFHFSNGEAYATYIVPCVHIQSIRQNCRDLNRPTAVFLIRIFILLLDSINNNPLRKLHVDSSFILIITILTRHCLFFLFFFIQAGFIRRHSH